MPVDAIVIRITGSSVRAWARQILHWRVQPRWYLYALGLPALLFAAVNGALALLGEPIDLALMADRAPSYLAGFAFVALLGGGRLGFQPTTAGGRRRRARRRAAGGKEQQMTTTAQALASGAFMAAEAIHVTGRRVVATVNWVSNLPAVVNVAYGLFVIGYYMLLEGYLGQTLGKMATGIKVVSAATGEAPGIAAAAIRTLLRIVDGLFSYAVAFITVLASWRRQRLGDMAAHTLSGIPQSAWSFGPYVIGVLALSVLVTPMFNAARGSILVTALFHFQMNGPAWPEAQPWENYLFAAAAVVVALLHRKAMLTRSQAVNEVLVPGAEQPSPEEAHSTATSRSPATGGPWPTAQQSLS